MMRFSPLITSCFTPLAILSLSSTLALISTFAPPSSAAALSPRWEPSVEWKNFSPSCYEFHLVDPADTEGPGGAMVLEGCCGWAHNQSAVWRTRQRLGDCLWNDGGVLKVYPGDASRSCRGCVLVGGDGKKKDTRMSCQCSDGYDGWKRSEVDLDTFVGNDDGWLMCNGASDPVWGYPIQKDHKWTTSPQKRLCGVPDEPDFKY